MSDDNLVSFRLSEELKELVEERAEEDGVTFSEKVRQYCRDGAGDPRQQRLSDIRSDA